MKPAEALRVPIFNIVNGSFVDGPGIRTTIFLKGCPLRCKWCCNPEGQAFLPQLRHLEAHCLPECGNCIAACPKQAISRQEGKLVIDRGACDNCGACVDSCWYSALGMYGDWQTPEELMVRIRREKSFMLRSGGGLTVGGGEATCYPAFCREIIRLCHEEGIHVAIDSCGYMTAPESIKVLEEADMVLFDLKGMDSARHRENTGVPNEPILETFFHLREIGKPVIVRLPLIPGLNDSKAELEALARLLAESPNVERVDLMPYHEYGCSKYDELGMAYPLKGLVRPYPEEAVTGLLEFFRGFGINIQNGG